MKKILTYVMAAAMALTVFAINPVEADAAPKSKGIEREGASKRTVYAGKSFDLEVEKGYKLKDNDLVWSVGNSKIVKITDKDKTDDEIDLKAVKAGKTKVYCKNKVTGNKISYTITVKSSKSKKPAKYGIARSGGSSVTVEVGDEKDIKVLKGESLSSKKVKWSVKDPSVVRFEDNKVYGPKVEVEGLKEGTTVVYAKNLRTGNHIAYTVNVIPDYDD